MRNKLLQYANLLWGSGNINRFDPSVRLLIESYTQELAKVKQDLSYMDTTLLEELALKLTPEKYTKIRPGYSLLHFFINRPEVVLTNRDVMGLPEADQKKNNDHIYASFSPLFSIGVYDTSVVNKIYDTGVYLLDSKGNKITSKKLKTAADPLKFWIGVKVNQEVEKLENFSFYFDLPHLKTINDLFELLPYTTVSLNGKILQSQSGLVNRSNAPLDRETEIIKNIYENQFITILEDIYLNNFKQKKFPDELLDYIEVEKTDEFLAELEPCYWFCFEFLPNFSKQDLEQLVVLTSVLPVINKNLTAVRLNSYELRYPYVVEGTIGEKLLEVLLVKDSFGLEYKPDQNDSSFRSGTYHVESLYNTLLENKSIEDKLIKLSELLVEQRASFPRMNNAKIESVIHAVAKADNRDNDSKQSSNKVALEEIGRISIIPNTGISHIDLEFWLTQGELVHKIAKATTLLASKTSRLYGCNGYLLHRAVGAKQFTKAEDIIAVDKFVYTSRDKVISKQDIINYCYTQFRKELSHVEVYLDTKLSAKPKQGFIRVIRVELSVKSNSRLMHTRGVLKDLKTRLALLSPSEYEYEISIIS